MLSLSLIFPMLGHDNEIPNGFSILQVKVLSNNEGCLLEEIDLSNHWWGNFSLRGVYILFFKMYLRMLFYLIFCFCASLFQFDFHDDASLIQYDFSYIPYLMRNHFRFNSSQIRYYFHINASLSQCYFRDDASLTQYDFYFNATTPRHDFGFGGLPQNDNNEYGM